jgi:hypothetical protein
LYFVPVVGVFVRFHSLQQAYNVDVTYNINGGTNVIGLVGEMHPVNITISTSNNRKFCL